MMRSPTGRIVTLSAVGIVLFLVSVPRVHQFAVQDNERAAISSILEAKTCTDADTWAQEMTSGLSGARTVPNTSLIKSRGYLLELAHRPDGSPFIRAWPSEHGATGRSAFLYDPERGLTQHSNDNAGWSGANSLRPDGTEAGWLERTSRR